jgi:hypothetical protein
MKTTHHFEIRKNSRGISDYMVDLVFEFGNTNGDRLILGKKKVEKLLFELEHLRRQLLKVCDKNGLAIVIEHDSLITAYPLHKVINKMK